MSSCAPASLCSHPRHFSYHGRKLVHVVSQFMSFVLQFFETMFPALFVAAHGIEYCLEIRFLAGPLVGHCIQIMTQLFRSSLASLNIVESSIHSS